MSIISFIIDLRYLCFFIKSLNYCNNYFLNDELNLIKLALSYSYILYYYFSSSNSIIVYYKVTLIRPMHSSSLASYLFLAEFLDLGCKSSGGINLFLLLLFIISANFFYYSYYCCIIVKFL